MALLHKYALLIALLVSVVDSYILRPFHVSLSHGASCMRNLVRNSRVPSPLPSIATSLSPTHGIDAQWLQSLRETWINEFDWEGRQDYMNR